MNVSEKDKDILIHILKYCNDIIQTTGFFGNTFEQFKDNDIYRNAVAMCVLQIGELSGYLSDDFKAKFNGVPWRNIKGMRNIIAHRYGEIDTSILWETIQMDVPVLREYCDRVSEQLS